MMKAQATITKRPRGLENHRIDRLGELQAVIGDGVVGRDAEEREQGQHADMLADHRPVGAQIGKCEGQQDQRRADPAQCAECDGRHIVGGIAADIDVAGPEQHRENEQHIGCIVEAAEEALKELLHVLRERRGAFSRTTGCEAGKEFARDRERGCCRHRLTV
jgi:hypothetical protein